MLHKEVFERRDLIHSRHTYIARNLYRIYVVREQAVEGICNGVDAGILLDHSKHIIYELHRIETEHSFSFSDTDSSADSDHSSDDELQVRQFPLDNFAHLSATAATSRQGNLEELCHLTSDEIERLMTSQALRCPSNDCLKENDLRECLRAMPTDVFQDCMGTH